MRATLAACAAVAAIGVAAGQATNFNAVLATPPTQLTNQFQLQNSVSVLISAGNVFYDADNDCIPLQAFEITDQNGNPLGPFQMPTANFGDYIVDVSSLNTGQGLKPYHRGVELVNASSRGWRLDYYKNGISGSVYSTVMSGPITPVSGSPGTYTLGVDLQLRWSEEGDSLNRLGQGLYSHIALALADFNSFTLTINGPGSATMSANLFATTTTTPPPTTASPTTPSPTGPPVSTPTATGAPTATPGTTTTTVEPVNREDDESTYESCIELARVAAEAREAEASDRGVSNSKKHKVKITAEERQQCEQYRSECWDAKGKKHKGKSKSHKCGKKKGKIGLSGLGFSDSLQRSTMMAAGAAALVLVAGYVKVAHTRHVLSEYEELDGDTIVDTTPVQPTALKAFGTHNPAELMEQAKSFHLPPGEFAPRT